MLQIRDSLLRLTDGQEAMLTRYERATRDIKRNSMGRFPVDSAGLDAESVSTLSMSVPITPGRFNRLADNPTRKARDDASDKRSVHVRQNFTSKGRPGGYVPPQTSSESNTQTRKSFDTRRVLHSIPPDDEMIEGTDVVFDMASPVGPLKTPTPASIISFEDASLDRGTMELSFESVWENTPERGKAGADGSQALPTHFSIRDPRYSDPSLLKIIQFEDQSSPHVSAEEWRRSLKLVEPWNPDHSRTPSPNYRGAKIIPEAVEGKGLHRVWRDDDETRDHDINKSNKQEGSAEEEDSLFDFREQAQAVDNGITDGKRQVKVTHKIRRPSPVAHNASSLQVEETSPEIVKPKRKSPTNLQERTQQAWKFRQKKNSNLRSKRDPDTPRQINSVSFRTDDTVQYFDPHIDENTDETGQSFDDKSLNSEYTKTLESEVEDMIKDILFIGSGTTSQPGRRKYKYKHEVKKRMRDTDPVSKRSGEEETQEQDDDVAALSKYPREPKSTVEAKEVPEQKIKNEVKQTQEFRGSKNDGRQPKPRKTLNDITEAELALWKFVDSGVTAVSSALGLTVDNDDDPSAKAKSQGPSSDNACAHEGFPFNACTGHVTQDQLETSSKPALKEFFDYAQNAMYGPLVAHATAVSFVFGGTNGNSVLSNIVTYESRSIIRCQKIGMATLILHRIREE